MVCPSGPLVGEDVVRAVLHQACSQEAINPWVAQDDHVVSVQQLKTCPILRVRLDDLREVVRRDHEKSVHPQREDELRQPRPEEATIDREAQLDTQQGLHGPEAPVAKRKPLLAKLHTDTLVLPVVRIGLEVVTPDQHARGHVAELVKRMRRDPEEPGYAHHASEEASLDIGILLREDVVQQHVSVQARETSTDIVDIEERMGEEAAPAMDVVVASTSDPRPQQRKDWNDEEGGREAPKPEILQGEVGHEERNDDTVEGFVDLLDFLLHFLHHDALANLVQEQTLVLGIEVVGRSVCDCVVLRWQEEVRNTQLVFHDLIVLLGRLDFVLLEHRVYGLVWVLVGRVHRDRRVSPVHEQEQARTPGVLGKKVG
mmetsp:Transcript_57520/g.146040  ORF Transcript_57520/g.146040 Transcript_57520/m.146040 type:complete len:371 (+) Transcript_57520:368-1480(+)